jgi:hypothetical protein
MPGAYHVDHFPSDETSLGSADLLASLGLQGKHPIDYFFKASRASDFQQQLTPVPRIAA